MDRIAFNLWGLPVYWYGLLFAGGFLAGTYHWSRLARRTGLPPALGGDLAVVIMIGTLIGARLAYILSNLDYFLANPGKILAFREGGMVFYGGLVMSTLLLVGFARRCKMTVPALLDFTATAVPLGHAFGRVGCFLNQCCGGVPAGWGFLDPEGIRRVPVQLFEAGGNLVIYVLLTAYYLRRPSAGRVTALYFVLYPVLRFTTEFWRGDERLAALGGLNAAQTTSLILIAAATALWIWSGRRPAAG